MEITNLTRTFRSRIALDQVSLCVPTGTVMGLVGENGAGKTTLIRHVLGLLRANPVRFVSSAAIPSSIRWVSFSRRLPLRRAG